MSKTKTKIPEEIAELARAYCELTQRCDFTGEPVATSCRAIRGTSADPTA